jgi:hypothetical protein
MISIPKNSNFFDFSLEIPVSESKAQSQIECHFALIYSYYDTLVHHENSYSDVATTCSKGIPHLGIELMDIFWYHQVLPENSEHLVAPEV